MTDDTEARFLCPECRTSERSSPEVWVAVLENFTVPCDVCGLLAKQVEVRRVNPLGLDSSGDQRRTTG